MTKEEQKQFEKEQRAAANEAIKQQAALDASIENMEKPGELQQPLESAEEREAAATASIEPAVVTAEAPVKPAVPAEPAATPTPAPVVTPAQSAVTPATPTTPTTTPGITQQIKATAGPAIWANPNSVGAQAVSETIEKPAVVMSAENDPSKLTRQQREQNLDTAIAENKIDEVTATDQLNKKNINAFMDFIEGQRQRNAERAAELRSIEQGNSRAARWAAIGEAVAAFGNSVAVAGGASHQQYKPVSQDWMRQADAARSERMKSVASMEDNLNQQRLRLQEMKTNGQVALINAQEKQMQTKLKNEYMQAQIEHQRAMTNLYDAKTQAQIKDAQNKVAIAAQREKLLLEQMEAYKALANQRNAAAANSSSRTQSQNSVDAARVKQLEEEVEKLKTQEDLNKAREGYWIGRSNGTIPGRVTPGTGPLNPAVSADEEKKNKKGGKLDFLDE